MPTTHTRRFRAKTHAGLRAVLSDLCPLVYARTPDMADDVAPHVRAASSIRRWGSKVVIISDDTNALAVKDDQQVAALLLPPGEGGRRTFGAELGNKKHKLDLEASVVLPDGRLVAFGSGSKRRRERLVVLGLDENVRLIDGSEFYAQLGSALAFSGSELNIEGAVVIEDTLRLFQRGNGAVIDERQPVNATADIALLDFVAWLDGRGPAPGLANIRQYELGRIQGVPWSFTDAATIRNGGVVFTAAAEASKDTYEDGKVYGSCFGLIRENEVELVEICDPEGQSSALKIEGIEPDPVQPHVFSVVIDMDQSDTAALLGRLEVTGFALS